MKTLMCVCFMSVCLLIVVGYQQVRLVDDVGDRNCVAIIDSKKLELSPGILHRTIVEAALRSVHGNDVRVVMHGSTDTPEDFIDSILTTPCKVTNISMFSLWVANIIKDYNVKLREDSIYLIAVGNTKVERVIDLYQYKYFYGKYDFADNVTLVSGGGYSRSFSCGFIKHYTLTKCVIPKFGPRSKFGPKSKFEAGVIEYKGELYLGSSFAAPVYAGTLLKAIMKNDRNNWYNW